MVKAILSEKAFIAAVQAAAGNITPKEKGAKKRRKAKQYLTPSPVDNNSDLHHPLPGKAEVHWHAELTVVKWMGMLWPRWT